MTLPRRCAEFGCKRRVRRPGWALCAECAQRLLSLAFGAREAVA